MGKEEKGWKDIHVDKEGKGVRGRKETDKVGKGREGKERYTR